MNHKRKKVVQLFLRMFNAPCSMFHASCRRAPCSMFHASCKGFTLLFAVLLGSLLFSLGLAISRIAVREVILSTSGKSSEAAFYAADAGIECALYHDIQKGAFPRPGENPPEINFILCNGANDNDIKVTYDNDDDGATVSFFEVTFSPVCAEVRVKKRSDTTVIESRGRNICGSENNPGRVERALRVTY